MRKYIAIASTAVMVAFGLVGLTQVAAEAHTHNVSANCQGLTVSLNNYRAESHSHSNHVKVTIDGVTEVDKNFSTSYNNTFSWNAFGHDYRVQVTAWDDSHYSFDTGTLHQDACQTIPEDASATLVVSPPTCDKAGFATITSEVHASRIGHSLDETVGTHTQEFRADAGHLFSDGTDTLTLTYTIEGATGHCAPPPPKVRHAHVRVHVTDKCNCFRDKVVMHHGSHVRVVMHHPSRLTWTFKVTGKRVGNKQYLLPSRIGGHHGWAKVQHYVVHTTNVPCPCHKTHTCPHNGPPHHHCPIVAGKLEDRVCT